MEKKVSVIIPCYNIEIYIDRCLVSLERQKIPMEELEIILVDDHSTDGTWEKLQIFEAKYPESVLIIHNDVNIRQGAIRNMALAYATAPYICMLCMKRQSVMIAIWCCAMRIVILEMEEKLRSESRNFKLHDSLQ